MEDLNQQALVKTFLAKCRTAGVTKLIIDLQASSGGYIFEGQDTFLQLFPTIPLLDVTRTRWTPFVDTMANMFDTNDQTTKTSELQYDTYNYVDAKLQNFPSARAFLGPHTIYGDNFTSIVRTNTTIAVEELRNESLADVAPQLFSADNIVLLTDGSCGSTCTIFMEQTVTQAGVRSVVVGGRPTTSPMQTMAGSKG